MSSPLLQKLQQNKPAIAAAALLLAALLAVANRYAVVQESNPAAVGIWVLDRFTGRVEFCSPGGGCTKLSRSE